MLHGTIKTDISIEKLPARVHANTGAVSRGMVFVPRSAEILIQFQCQLNSLRIVSG